MTYVRNAWYVAAWSSQIEASKPFAITVLGERIVIYRTQSGRLAALEDRCIHRLAPLSLGRCEGENLRCMYHGLLFNAEGRVIQIPGQDLIPARAHVRTYPVAERHSWIWVWMGNPEQADETLIPPVVGLEHPDYLLGHGNLDYAAEARLINENLLDFSHIAYVHAQSFRIGPEMAEKHADITPIERGIRYIRWVEDLPVNAAGKPDMPADSYLTYDYLLPGILLMSTASFPPGTARRVNRGAPPDLSEAVRDVTFTSQAVTPMGEKSARYFFSWGPHRKFGNEAVRDAMMSVLDMAFHEDKIMIEAQQCVIDDRPDAPVMPTTHDRSVTMFYRMAEQLAQAESRTIAAAE